MFARFRNLFAKKADEETIEAATTMPEVPSIVVDEPPKEDDEPKESHQIASLTVHNITSCAPLASEEEDLYSSNGHEESLSDSTNELSKLLEAINESTKLPELSSEDNDEDGDDVEADGDYDDDDDETASTSSVKTKIAKASIERDIILEEEEEGEDDVEKENDEDNVQHSLDKIKALIRNDSETYPQSDYTDNDTEEPTPSHSRTASLDSEAEAAVSAGLQLQLDNSHFTPDFSVVADELPLDSSPSPLHDSGRTSSAGSEALSGETSPPATLKILPTGSNELACAAITHKLSAIAEVAESLDAVIRDVQQEGEVDGPSNSKKLGNIEDWQSRSTEDESFATASEGNFTPNSHSSSFQTASGRTSSYIGSAKNSFDEADDSTLSTFEIPELPQSPVHNMSFDSSELSYFSAQQPSKADDQDSVAGVADLHSQSVTPTPDDEQQQLHPMPQPIESDSELEGFGLASGITTELAPSVSTAHTPEVSANCRNAPTSATAAATSPATNSNETKPPASWRRSKYYENITKQTIKGFL